MRDVCALSQVCKQWRRISQDESLPLQRERLDRIVFHSLPAFDQLPKERLSVTLRTFTIFQNVIVGETETGDLCLYDPEKKKLSALDFKPPFFSDYPGEFFTSSEACVYCFSYRDLYHIDLLAKTAKKIPFEVPHGYYEHALLKSNLIRWSFPPLDMSLFPNPKRETVYPYLKIDAFDLIAQCAKEMSYPTSRRPKLFPCGERIVMQHHRWLYLLDAGLKKVGGGTYWPFTISNAHLIGNKLLMEGSSFGSEGYRSTVTIKDVGDSRNYGEEQFYLPGNSRGNLHAFFVERLGWRFLCNEGILWKRALWSLENGQLTRVSLLPEL